jgi:hypothetical protein
MLTVETIGASIQGKTIKEIARDLKLSPRFARSCDRPRRAFAMASFWTLGDRATVGIGLIFFGLAWKRLALGCVPREASVPSAEQALSAASPGEAEASRCGFQRPPTASLTE